MNTELRAISVRLSKDDVCEFHGRCLISVVALDHDDRVRRQFAVYSSSQGYVAERIDNPGTIDVRFWGAYCADSQAIYDFFGNEPLANYLYGSMHLSVPGLQTVRIT
ncbi:MAG: hypothetical protein AB8B64_09200 [Granulosicoccus sp.]